MIDIELKQYLKTHLPNISLLELARLIDDNSDEEDSPNQEYFQTFLEYEETISFVDFILWMDICLEHVRTDDPPLYETTYVRFVNQLVALNKVIKQIHPDFEDDYIELIIARLNH